MSVYPLIFMTFLFSQALVLVQSGYNYVGNYKRATSPYSSQYSVSNCESQCTNDPSCQGYAIDTSNRGCFLSTCNAYIFDSSCSSCYFADKKPTTGPVLCPGDTTLAQTTTPELTTTEEKTTRDQTTTNDLETTTISETTSTIETTSTMETTSTIETTTASVTTTIMETTSTMETTTTIETTVALVTTEDKTTNQQTTSHEIDTSSSFETLTSTEYIIVTDQSTVLKQITNGTVKCVCNCKNSNITLEGLISLRKKELSVNVTQISSHVRKLTCASDFRLSSKSIGSVGIIVFIAIFGFIFVSDILPLFRKCKNLFDLNI